MDAGKSDWTPFRPTEEQRKAVSAEVADIAAIQQTLLKQHAQLCCPDRVAHQYQIAGGRVQLHIDTALPDELAGVGLFTPGAVHTGIARFSTGLGTPHIETNPDFLGLMAAFQTEAGTRVDFLALNAPTAPADTHRDFMDVLHATTATAGAEMPLIGDWGDYDIGNLAAEQTLFGLSLIKRMGVLKAGRTVAHIVKETLRTFRSSTVYQPYWTGINEVSGHAGKFTFVPRTDENPFPGFRPGEWHLSEEWQRRQAAADVEFDLYWIPYLDADSTPTVQLTAPWQEDHKRHIGALVFPQLDAESEPARLWSLLAAEMGANPGNWVSDRDDRVRAPATSFELARTFAYRNSQQGRNALTAEQIASVFRAGDIDTELARELERRGKAKREGGHRSSAPQADIT